MNQGLILYDYAMTFAGQPYRWGGDDPVNGFDCSGLVIELLQAAGMWPKGKDATAQGLCDAFPNVIVEPRLGTLAFFGKTKEAITHVSFCLNATSMLEAGGGGSATKTLADAAAQNAFVRVRPLSWRADLVALKHPSYPWKG